VLGWWYNGGGACRWLTGDELWEGLFAPAGSPLLSIELISMSTQATVIPELLSFLRLRVRSLTAKYPAPYSIEM